MKISRRDKKLDEFIGTTVKIKLFDGDFLYGEFFFDEIKKMYGVNNYKFRKSHIVSIESFN